MDTALLCVNSVCCSRCLKLAVAFFNQYIYGCIDTTKKPPARPRTHPLNTHVFLLQQQAVTMDNFLFKLGFDTELYNRLEVPPGASEAEIRKSYKKLSLKYHPDRHVDSDKEKYTEKMKSINEAKEVLLDRKRRAVYHAKGLDAALRASSEVSSKKSPRSKHSDKPEKRPHEHRHKSHSSRRERHKSHAESHEPHQSHRESPRESPRASHHESHHESREHREPSREPSRRAHESESSRHEPRRRSRPSSSRAARPLWSLFFNPLSRQRHTYPLPRQEARRREPPSREPPPRDSSIPGRASRDPPFPEPPRQEPSVREPFREEPRSLPRRRSSILDPLIPDRPPHEPQFSERPVHEYQFPSRPPSKEHSRPASPRGRTLHRGPHPHDSLAAERSPSYERRRPVPSQELPLRESPLRARSPSFERLRPVPPRVPSPCVPSTRPIFRDPEYTELPSHEEYRRPSRALSPRELPLRDPLPPGPPPTTSRGQSRASTYPLSRDSLFPGPPPTASRQPSRVSTFHEPSPRDPLPPGPSLAEESRRSSRAPTYRESCLQEPPQFADPSPSMESRRSSLRDHLFPERPGLERHRHGSRPPTTRHAIFSDPMPREEFQPRLRSREPSFGEPLSRDGSRRQSRTREPIFTEPPFPEEGRPSRSRPSSREPLSREPPTWELPLRGQPPEPRQTTEPRISPRFPEPSLRDRFSRAGRSPRAQFGQFADSSPAHAFLRDRFSREVPSWERYQQLPSGGWSYATSVQREHADGTFTTRTRTLVVLDDGRDARGAASSRHRTDRDNGSGDNAYRSRPR